MGGGTVCRWWLVPGAGLTGGVWWTWPSVRLAYQPPTSITFLSEQTSHQQPASSTFLSEQISTSHQSPAKRTRCWMAGRPSVLDWPGDPIHSWFSWSSTSRVEGRLIWHPHNSIVIINWVRRIWTWQRPRWGEVLPLLRWFTLVSCGSSWRWRRPSLMCRWPHPFFNDWSLVTAFCLEYLSNSMSKVTFGLGPPLIFLPH
jgi:hypothetical protein